MPYKVESIDSTKTALIVVDMQNDFVAPTAHVMTTDEFIARTVSVSSQVAAAD